MKKLMIYLVATSFLASCTKNLEELNPKPETTLRSQTIPTSSLPEEILSYTNSNFPDQIILNAELDDNEYEIDLDNGLELTFSLDGTFLGWDADTPQLATSMLPTTILEYIATTYPNALIEDAEQTTLNIEVELNNGTELYFDLNGNLLSVEMDD